MDRWQGAGWWWEDLGWMMDGSTGGRWMDSCLNGCMGQQMDEWTGGR